MRRFFILLFFFAAMVFAGKVAPLPGPLRPNGITVGGGRVYITEDTTVYIYSLKDYRLIKKFGRAGEGPGELKEMIHRIDIQPDHIIVNSVGRMSYFTKDGDFIKQASATSASINYESIGDGYVGMRLLAENKTLYFAINLYDAKLAKIKEIHRFKHPFQRGKNVDPTDARVCSYHVYDDKIFIDKENGIIDVYKKDGEKLYSIDPGIEKIKISKHHEKRYMDSWKSNRIIRAEYKAFKDRLKFPKYFSFIRNFHVIEGKIYILTHKEIAGKNELLVYSIKGKLLKKVLVPLVNIDTIIPQLYNFYTIKNGKLFILVEDAGTETWELHITEI